MSVTFSENIHSGEHNLYTPSLFLTVHKNEANSRGCPYHHLQLYIYQTHYIMGAWITTLLESFTNHCKNILREAIYEIANRFFNSFVYACAFVPWVIGVAILLVSYLSSHWQVSSDFNNGLWRWCNKSDCGFVPRSSYNKGW